MQRTQKHFGILCPDGTSCFLAFVMTLSFTLLFSSCNAPTSNEAFTGPIISHTDFVSELDTNQPQGGEALQTVKTRDDLILNEYYDEVEYSRKEYKPEGYPENIRTGLARELEKYTNDSQRRYPVVVRYMWNRDDYKQIFTLDGLSYAENVQKEHPFL